MTANSQQSSQTMKPTLFRQRWIVRSAFTIATLAILAVAIWGGMFVTSLYRASAMLEEEISLVRKSGKPLTIAELPPYHQIPAGRVDVTDKVLPILKKLHELRVSEKEHYSEICEDFKYCENKAVFWSTHPRVSNYLEKMQPSLVSLADFNSQQNAIQISGLPAQGSGRFNEHGDWLVSCQTVIGIKLRSLLEQKSADQAIECVRLLATIARLIEHNQLHFARSLSMEIYRECISYIHDILHCCNLTDEQLFVLQELVRTITPEQTFPDYFIASRAFGWAFLHDPYLVNSASLETFGGWEGWPHATAEKPIRVAEAAVYLKTMRSLNQALESGYPALNRAANELTSLLNSTPLDKLKPEKVLFARALLEIKELCGFIARRNGCEVCIAALRYLRKHGSLPEGAAILVPEFLRSLPNDPYDGTSMKTFIRKGSSLPAEAIEFSAYAVGRNLTDELGGDSPSNSGIEPGFDLLLDAKSKVPLPKKYFSLP